MQKTFKIENFTLHPLEKPKFIRTALARYLQNDIPREWETVQAHDSVAILLYHKEKKAFILVRQFRAAVYMHNREGVTLELCAGLMDKDLPPEEIAKEEIEEECGYCVNVNDIKKITSFYASVGFAGSKQILYYAEVDESMRTGEGGGIEGEEISVITLPLEDTRSLMYDESIAKTSGLLFALCWWFENKASC